MRFDIGMLQSVFSKHICDAEFAKLGAIHCQIGSSPINDKTAFATSQNKVRTLHSIGSMQRFSFQFNIVF